ncbi:capsule biosynthesis protein CapA [Desulfovibrio sp. An276]|uniref:HAD hydrolase-like protein n=1 Tax=Desulfovibrio sp. An276 TaxID=1965618 RepID=UPI000B3A0370|nr:HAD hydrolase-like protein [Desulfovibrio sp. An276]OUO50783.1 capsule biosynthesis protein CapA [Desulfovibrio sp. An276]
MNIIYYMDPFIDMDNEFDDRSFVAKNDLNADYLGRYLKKTKNNVYFVGLDIILNKRNIKEHLKETGVKIINISKSEIEGILNINNITINMIMSKMINDEVNKKIKNFLYQKLKNLSPDFIIYWESCIEQIYEIFPNAIFLEGTHTGFSRIEQNVDIIYNVSTSQKRYSDIFFNEINKSFLSEKDIIDINKFSLNFKRHILFKTQINREFLDPEHKFKYLILYAGNFPSLRFKYYSGFTSNSEVLQYLLKIIPEDCAIVYSKHHLDNEQINFLEQNQRIINISKYRESDPNITLRVMPYVDAIINVYSNIFMPAMVIGVPVFSFGKSPNAKFSLDRLDKLTYWLNNGKKITYEYQQLTYKILKYIITHKVNTRFLHNCRNSFLYLKKIKYNIENKLQYLDWLPSLSTIQGYTAQFCQARLVQVPFANCYNQTNYEILLGYLLNEQIKNIGFDIFDTMLYRPVIKSSDIFDLIEEDVYKITGLRSFNFSKSRIAAENIARQGKIEISFDDIYKEIQNNTGFSDEIIAKIKQLELNIEEQMLFPRESIQNYFNLAKFHGKNIFIASDMYLPEIVIRNILEKNGYELSNVKLYISCEVNNVKYNGSLFNYILKKEKYNPCETIFIGDNIKSDIERSKDLGIIPFLYPKAIEQLKQTKIFDPQVLNFLMTKNFNFHIGLIANKIFDNPFILYDRSTIINNSFALLGYYILGPFVLSLTLWLIDNIKNKKYDKVLFTSRDSRIIIDIYNLINKVIYKNSLPKSEYIYLSRTSTLPAYTDNPRRMTLLTLYNSQLNVKDYLKKVFNINIENDENTKKILKSINLKYNDDIKNNFNKIIKFVNLYLEKKEFSNEIKNIKEYFYNIIENKNVAMFDLGARGTSRDIISDLLGVDIDLYVFRKVKYKCHNNIFAYLHETLNPYRHGINTVFPAFCELLLSDATISTCKGYKYINDKIEPDIELNDIDKNLNLILSTQNYIYIFCNDYINIFNEKIKYLNSQSFDSYIFPMSWLCAHTTDTKLLLKYEGYDPLWKNSKISIIATKINSVNKNTINYQNNQIYNTALSKITQCSFIKYIRLSMLKLFFGNNKKLWEAYPTQRDIFIFCKRYFYKTQLTRKIWDKGRSIYLNFLKK